MDLGPIKTLVTVLELRYLGSIVKKESRFPPVYELLPDTRRTPPALLTFSTPVPRFNEACL